MDILDNLKVLDNTKKTTINKENNVYIINIERNSNENYSALLINTGEKIDKIKKLFVFVLLQDQIA